MKIQFLLTNSGYLESIDIALQRLCSFQCSYLYLDFQAVNQKAASDVEKQERLTVIKKLEETEYELKASIHVFQTKNRISFTHMTNNMNKEKCFSSDILQQTDTWPKCSQTSIKKKQELLCGLCRVACSRNS